MTSAAGDADENLEGTRYFESLLARHRSSETRAYHALVNNGGRPAYRIELFNHVYKHPEYYTAVLRPWRQNREPLEAFDARDIFKRQLRRWRDFRKWQNNNRGLDDDDGGFPRFVENMKRQNDKDCTDKAYKRRLAAIEADPSILKPEWDELQKKRERHRLFVRDHGCDTFQEYSDAVQHRLAQRHFYRPFQLREDPRLQDKLTTWIEYLGFEYWKLIMFTDSVQWLRPGYDEARQTLMDAKVLNSHVSEHDIRTRLFKMERDALREQAERAVYVAQSEVDNIHERTQGDSQDAKSAELQQVSMLAAATHKLKSAQTHLSLVVQTNQLVSNYVEKTREYVEAEESIARQRVLVEWVRDEARLLERELCQVDEDSTEDEESTEEDKDGTEEDEDGTEEDEDGAEDDEDDAEDDEDDAEDDDTDEEDAEEDEGEAAYQQSLTAEWVIVN